MRATPASPGCSDVFPNRQTAALYLDRTFASTNHPVTNGNNAYSAIATDSYGRTSTDTVSVSLPSSLTFGYDLNGNLTNWNGRSFEYDDENQLTRVTESGQWKTEFVYDGKMRLRQRQEYGWSGSAWVLTNDLRYVYDGMLVLQERDASNIPVLSYTRGRDLSGTREGAGGIGGLLAQTDHRELTGSAAHAFYHADGNGNVTALVNTNQVIVARYSYDPYGNTLSMSGPKAEVNRYRFSSKEHHGKSGFYYYGYRFYVPELQRWLNRDPIQERGGINLHAFAGNEPVLNFDPFGNAWCTTRIIDLNYQQPDSSCCSGFAIGELVEQKTGFILRATGQCVPWGSGSTRLHFQMRRCLPPDDSIQIAT